MKTMAAWVPADEDAEEAKSRGAEATGPTWAILCTGGRKGCAHRKCPINTGVKDRVTIAKNLLKNLNCAQCSVGYKDTSILSQRASSLEDTQVNYTGHGCSQINAKWMVRQSVSAEHGGGMES
jgi:hypothetical protein